MKKKTVMRVVVTVVIILLFVTMVMSGAVEINLLKAWDWIAGGVQLVAGKIAGFISPRPRDFVLLIIGLILGFIFGYKVKGWIKEDEGEE